MGPVLREPPSDSMARRFPKVPLLLAIHHLRNRSERNGGVGAACVEEGDLPGAVGERGRAVGANHAATTEAAHAAARRTQATKTVHALIAGATSLAETAAGERRVGLRVGAAVSARVSVAGVGLHADESAFRVIAPPNRAVNGVERAIRVNGPRAGFAA
jgi:hypothetical protein